MRKDISDNIKVSLKLTVKGSKSELIQYSKLFFHSRKRT